MEAFSLLKYWRTGGGSAATAAPFTGNQNTTDFTVTDTVSGGISESDGEVNADDGPFFDMEFAVNGDDKVKSGEIEDDDEEKGSDSDDESDGCDCENEGEIKFTLSPASSGGDSIDPNISLSPSDELFFKGRLVPLPEPNCKPVSPVKSATKLRVLMLKLKKSTKLSSPKTPESERNVAENHEKQQIKPHVKTPAAKFFTVKFKVDDVPMLSIFTRENSSKPAITKSKKQITTEESSTIEDDKVFSKDVMNKYLKKVKPLYVRVSKRYGEKLGFSGHLSLSGSMKTGSDSVKISESTPRRNVKTQKQGISFPAKLRVVRKQLGKSKSASSTVTAADSSPVTMASKHRDDSLLLQEDGIQSAIMHCKRSFKASREIEGSGVCEANEKRVNVSAADLSCSADKTKGDDLTS